MAIIQYYNLGFKKIKIFLILEKKTSKAVQLKPVYRHHQILKFNLI